MAFSSSKATVIYTTIEHTTQKTTDTNCIHACFNCKNYPNYFNKLSDKFCYRLIVYQILLDLPKKKLEFIGDKIEI